MFEETSNYLMLRFRELVRQSSSEWFLCQAKCVNRLAILLDV